MRRDYNELNYWYNILIWPISIKELHVTNRRVCLPTFKKKESFILGFPINKTIFLFIIKSDR